MLGSGPRGRKFKSFYPDDGAVPKRRKGAVLKTARPGNGRGGSNPSRPAIKEIKVAKALEIFDNLTEKERADLIKTVLAKKNGEIDMDWAEIVEQFHLKIKPDTLRKAAVGLVLADSVGLLLEKPPLPTKDRPSSVIKPETVEIPHIETEKADVQPKKKVSEEKKESADYVERQKVRDLRNEIRQDLREISRSRHLEEAIVEAIAKLPDLP